MMKKHLHKTIKVLPEYLQPKIISAVAFIHSCSPDLEKAVKRIHELQKHLNEKEMMWVMSLLTFEKLLDIVKESPEFGKYQNKMKERTIN
jgi:hypothetical protein